MRYQKTLLYIAPVLFLAMWSSGAVFAKIGLNYADTWSFLFIRASIALLLLTAIVFLKAPHHFTQLHHHKKELVWIIVAGILLQVLYLTFYFLAISTGTSLGLIIMILGTQPILTLLLQPQKMRWRSGLLILTCFMGLCLAMLGYYEVKAVNALGIIFALLSTLSITLGTWLQAKTTQNPTLTLWLQTLISWVIFLGIIVAKGLQINYHWQFVVACLWMGGMVSVGALLLLLLMLTHNSFDKVSTLFFMLPIITICLDSWLFDTALSPLSLMGATLVCCALWVYLRRTE